MMRAALRSGARLARTLRAHAVGAAQAVVGRPAREEVRVSYALRVPRPDEAAVGGIVKLQHLSARFPEAARRANVLYLVSSRLPDAAPARAAWARRRGIRVVLNQNGVAYPAWYGGGWRRANADITRLLEVADHVFYQSGFCRLSADRFAGPASGAAEVLVNPVDTARFTPAGKPAGARALTLLLAGSQDQRYRFESAVATVAVLRRGGVDAELLVTGRLGWTADPATARREADAILDRLAVADAVTLLGPYTQVVAPSIYQRADIVLHTKYNDPCPTVVLEALASGRPVVYSRSGGVPELVGDEAGVGVEVPLGWDEDIAPDPEALAAAVVAVRARAAEAGAAARRRAVERFDVGLWLARHQTVFEELVHAS